MRYWRSLLIGLAFVGVGWWIWSSLGGSSSVSADSKPTATAPVQSALLADASNTAPVPTTKSGTAELGLARHLRKIGAKMYGAYWCPHCHDQIALFGKEAYSILPYVECAQDGKNSQANACLEAGVRGFPTWSINGKKYEGTQTLEQLAQASGYKGPQNFQNVKP